MRRRSFFPGLAGLGATALVRPEDLAAAPAAPAPEGSLGVHPFVAAHPEAVFIRRTRVAAKTDAEAIRGAARGLFRQLFALRRGQGVPSPPVVAIKPNLTSTKKTGLTHAIVTDPYAVEGLVDALRERGVPASSIYAREGLMVEQPTTGYPEMALRAGIHYGDPVAREPLTVECPDGVVFRRTRYLGPFATPGSFLINVAKHKTHSMGLTLCVKNLQGTNVPPYIRFCGGINPAIGEAFQPDAEAHVNDLYEKHRRAGLPRWDTAKGAWMEMWAQRTIDHYALVQPTVGLHVIEGIYAQNGDGFDGGPGPSGLPEVFMTNLLVFGRDAFRVDIVGHWLGGHEPGNFGLFHLAKERGVSTALDPRNIPVYEWTERGPELRPLASFERTPLATPYLERTGEPKYHVCDEPFAYAPEPRAACLTGGPRPSLRALGPAPGETNGRTFACEYGVPDDGPAALEVYDDDGRRAGVVRVGRASRGIHAASWEPGRAVTPGTYWWRLRAAGVDLLRPFELRA
jgi:uncharacterized protein (DUF362 family)